MNEKTALGIRDPFGDVVFATRDLQNDMFCQALEPERDFRVGSDPDNLGKRKIILIKYRERERERERERVRERNLFPAALSPPSLETYLGSERTRSTHLPPHN